MAFRQDARSHLSERDAEAAAASLVRFRAMRPDDAEGLYLEGVLAELEERPLETALERTTRSSSRSSPTSRWFKSTRT